MFWNAKYFFYTAIGVSVLFPPHLHQYFNFPMQKRNFKTSKRVWGHLMAAALDFDLIHPAHLWYWLLKLDFPRKQESAEAPRLLPVTSSCRGVVTCFNRHRHVHVGYISQMHKDGKSPVKDRITQPPRLSKHIWRLTQHLSTWSCVKLDFVYW